jgi:uncharacterized HAD superfamily protein
MSDKTADFMLEEYKQIANAYQDLHAQQNELVKSYLTVVAIPASVLTVAAQLVGIENIDPETLLGTIASVGMPILLILITVLCLVGLAVVLALVAIRAEALLYVRTVNCVRRYFVERDPRGNLKQYLVLPDYDTSPPFWEGARARSFWNVTIVALLNSAIAFATLLSWAQWAGHEGWLLPGIGCILWLILQELLHFRILNQTEKNYKEKFTGPFMPGDKVIGIDLDGVLNDLAGAVIDVAQAEFGLAIDRSDITSHRLEKCTGLTPEQVHGIFASPKTFEEAAPLADARVALEHLFGQGWTIHILTDRFWGKLDWRLARAWLSKHGFKWNHLNLVRAQDKAEYSEVHGIRLFVEDNYDTAVSLSSVCDKVYLLNQSYNQGNLPANVLRITEWHQIVQDLSE